MTADELQTALKSFLSTNDPEVLCVTGDWGVGKSYQWQLAYDAARRNKVTGLKRYSYVSLFGINSLDGLKQSLFENLEFITPEGEASYWKIVEGANKLGQQSKKAIGALSYIPWVGDALSKLVQPYFFSSIRNQIICIDDLERRGAGLQIKDILGLISFLREQRGCKVILLLNENKIDGNDGDDFTNFFEKTIDSKIVFLPSPAASVEIALKGEPNTDLATLVRKYATLLQVRNIRVIKKILRLIKTVLPLATELDESVRTQIVHSLVIFGWSHFDTGASPPTLDYLAQDQMSRYVDRKDGQAIGDEEKRWDTIISDYGFSSVDEFDLVLLQFVRTGQLDTDLLSAEAKKQEAKNRRLHQAGSFEASFRPLHDSFADNLDEVSDSIVRGIKENLDVLSRSNLDEAVFILRRLEQEQQAEEAIDYAIENASQDFWIRDSSFERRIQDQRIKAEIAKQQQQAIPIPDFERDLLKAAQSLNPEAIREVSTMPVEAYVKLFRSRVGEDLRALTSATFDYRQISNASEDMRLIVANAEEAMRRIAAESPLNAFRAEKYSVSKLGEG